MSRIIVGQAPARRAAAAPAVVHRGGDRNGRRRRRSPRASGSSASSIRSAGPISGDPGRLQQVVWNLLSNAIKFTPRGGTVQVRPAAAGRARRDRSRRHRHRHPAGADAAPVRALPPGRRLDDAQVRRPRPRPVARQAASSSCTAAPSAWRAWARAWARRSRSTCRWRSRRRVGDSLDPDEPGADGATRAIDPRRRARRGSRCSSSTISPTRAISIARVLEECGGGRAVGGDRRGSDRPGRSGASGRAGQRHRDARRRRLRAAAPGPRARARPRRPRPRHRPHRVRAPRGPDACPARRASSSTSRSRSRPPSWWPPWPASQAAAMLRVGRC